MVHDTQIGRLQLHTRPNGQAASQAVVARQLRQARLHPTHLPRSAILVIRQMISRRAPNARWSNTVAWAKQLQQQVDGLARQAALPYKQGANDSAPSVLFFDSVELLVCFTEDLLSKRSRWYWQELFPDLSLHATSFISSGEMIATAWLAYPEALSGTLVHLPKPVAAQALATLNRTQLQQVIAVLHRHYGLTSKLPHEAERGTKNRSTTATNEPPWQPWLPKEMTARLQPLAIYLWGVSHLLKETPSVARGPTFMADAIQWIEAEEVALDNARLEEAALERASQSFDSRHAHTYERANTDQELSPEARLDSEMDQAPKAFTSPDDHPQRFADAESQYAALQAEFDDERLQPEHSMPPQKALDSVRTQLGGAFYLLNVVSWLEATGIPSEDEPKDPWIGVAVLMVELLGDQRDNLRTDPLWALLAKLANQPAEALWQALDQRTLCQEPSDELVSTILWWQVQFQQLIFDQLTQRLTGDRETLTELFSVPAYVRTTNTHIDVHFPQDAVSIDIRRSGLDRSPGWVPIFGYIITFVFGSLPEQEW